MSAISDSPPEPAGPESTGPTSLDSAIVMRGIKKRFGATVAVDDVTLRVRRGSVFGLIGPNGAGKTTSFSMMAGFLRPTEGEVRILGHAPEQVDALRGRVGVLPQDAILPAADRVGEFLVHLGRLQGLDRDQATHSAQTGLAAVGGAEWWKQKCGSLSHGMAKRVQLAQALLGQPEVILLDEPTAGLDPRIAFEVRRLIASFKGKATLVISSHNLHELEAICDAAAVLDRGRLVASGSISELTSQAEEIHVELAPGSPLPMPVLQAIPFVKTVNFDPETNDLTILFSKDQADAETVIGHVLMALLQNQARVSGVSKGRGLEQRVMELTGGATAGAQH